MQAKKKPKLTKVVTSPSRDFTPQQIRTLIDHHKKQGAGKVVFLEEMHWFSSVRKDWTGDVTGALFWQENIPTHIPGATNWFGYYWKREYDQNFELIGKPNLLVFGMPTFEPVIDAVYIPSIDTLSYSRYQHDFFAVPGSPVSVDGGRCYTRVLYKTPSDYVVVPYNLLTKTFEFDGRTRHVDI